MRFGSDAVHAATVRRKAVDAVRTELHEALIALFYWKSFRDSTLNVATDVLGFVKRKHQDWFDENDEDIEPLLSAMHAAHRDFIGSKQSPALKNYLECKRAAQKRLRQMKNKWWEDKAAELQEAADTHNTKALFDGLKAVYGPR